MFDIAIKDRIIPESPAKLLRQCWKKPQAVLRQVPSVAQFEAIVADIRGQMASPPGEVPQGGDQDRAVAGDLIIPAPRYEVESHWVATFCAEPERSQLMRGHTPDLFTRFDQVCPGRRLKRELRQGYQEDIWREITALRDTVFDIVSYSGTRSTPPYSLWMLVELLEAQGWLNPYINAMLPLAEIHQEATGAVFVLGGRFNSVELYATPALFRQMWPKLIYAMAVEALVEQRQVGGAACCPRKARSPHGKLQGTGTGRWVTPTRLTRGFTAACVQVRAPPASRLWIRSKMGSASMKPSCQRSGRLMPSVHRAWHDSRG